MTLEPLAMEMLLAPIPVVVVKDSDSHVSPDESELESDSPSVSSNSLCVVESSVELWTFTLFRSFLGLVSLDFVFLAETLLAFVLSRVSSLVGFSLPALQGRSRPELLVWFVAGLWPSPGGMAA